MQWVPLRAAFFYLTWPLTLVDFLLVFNLFMLKAVLAEGFDLFLRCRHYCQRLFSTRYYFGYIHANIKGY
jgi:hypothetical protein